MCKRHHPLFVGEIVYDSSMNIIGEIKKLKDGKVWLDQSGFKEYNEKCFKECYGHDFNNWVTTENTVYQIVNNRVDCRTLGLICYEHNDEDYPYYSPSLGENLYDIETQEINSANFTNDLWDLVAGNYDFMCQKLFINRYFPKEEDDNNTGCDIDFNTIVIGDFEISIKKVEK